MPAPTQFVLRAVIENGIKRPIRILLGHHCHPAALVVTFSGMDTMAYLNMPAAKSDVMRSDFIAWTGKYMRVAGGQQLTGDDLYGARCSVLHGGAHSRFSREGRGKLVSFGAPGSSSRGARDAAQLSISVDVLAAAFFSAIDAFLADLARDEQKASVAHTRLENLLRLMPYQP